MVRGTRDSGTSTPQKIRVKEYKLRQDKRWNPAINADVCITVRVSTVFKDVMGVVQWTTNSQTAQKSRESSRQHSRFRNGNQSRHTERSPSHEHNLGRQPRWEKAASRWPSVLSGRRQGREANYHRIRYTPYQHLYAHVLFDSGATHSLQRSSPTSLVRWMRNYM